MSTGYRRASEHLERLLSARSVEELQERLRPRHEALPPRISGGLFTSLHDVENRWKALNTREDCRAALADPQTLAHLDRYRRSIENFIGTIKVPVGIAGPLRVNGLFARGDFYVPLATTETALVASYNRGAQLISEAGGCSAMVLNEGVSRAPGFAFRNLLECGQFVVWVLSQMDTFRRVAKTTTRHGELVDMRVTVEGNHVYLNLEFLTGDAAGQNMVTIATDAICTYVCAHSPVLPRYHFLEANLSGDKKASVLSFLSVRGKKVTAEVIVPAGLVQTHLRTTVERMVSYSQVSSIGGVLSGTIGVHGHYANGLAALHIACGQDAACVAESAVGVTRMEASPDGGLYAAVTLPNLIVGTIGGGTGLPSQQACLEILGLAGTGKAQALAEVCAALALAGELSITGALCAGDFARAHKGLTRRRRNPTRGARGPAG